MHAPRGTTRLGLATATAVLLTASLLVPSTVPPATLAAGADHAERLAAGLAWHPLDGPPGGNTALMQQDHVRPRNLYVATGRGLYHSTDQGDTWVLLGAATRDVWSIDFGDAGAVACGAGGTLLIAPGSEAVETIGPPCYSVAARGTLVFASRNSEHLAVPGREPRVSLEWTDLASTPRTWTDITPQRELWADLASRVGPDHHFLGIDHLVAMPGRLLAMVALGNGPGDAERTASRLLVSEDRGRSWRRQETGLPAGLPLQRLIHDPRRGTLVALGYEHRSEAAFQPLARLARLSRDGGRRWRPLTPIRDITAPSIGDVDFVGKRTVLTNVDQSVVELRGRGEVLRRWDGPAVKGYSLRFTLDELLFDQTDPRVIYGRGILGFEGIIRSRDGGRTWHRLTGGMAAAPAANLTVHPTDPQTFIASGNLGYLPHITRDGGATWAPLVGGASMADEVVFDPSDPRHIVMVSEISDVLESRDGGRSWQPIARHFSADRVHDIAVSADGDAIYSANLGNNVSRMIGLRPRDEVPLGQGERLWHNLEGSPDYAYTLEAMPDGTVLAGQSPHKFEDHAAVWRYRPGEPRDRSRWQEALRVDGAAGITDIALGPGREPAVYAGVTGTHAGVWVSHDLGASWSRSHTDGFDFVTVHAVAIDPRDHEVVYAAPWGAGLFVSRDGGATWSRLQAPTVSVAAIIAGRDGPGHLLIGDRVRPVVWQSHDHGRTWDPLVEFDADAHYRVMSLADLSDGLYVSLLDRTDRGLAVFAGAPDSGSTFRLDESGPHAVEGLPRSVLAFSEGDDGVYAVGHIRGIYRIRADRAQDISGDLPDIGFNDVLALGGDVWVAGGVDLDARLQPRVDDAAVSHNIYRHAADGTWRPLLEGDPFGSAIKHLEATPERPGHLYAATANGVHVSVDGGASWHAAVDGLSIANVGALAVAGDRVAAGTLGGGVSVGDVDRAVPERVAWRPAGGPSVHVANVRIVTHPRDPSRLWASAYPGGVFRSTDGGRTWEESNFGLPSFEVVDPLLQGYYSLAVDAARPELLYLAIAGHGIFRSTDGAATWLPLGDYGADRELMTAGLRALLVDPRDGRRLWLATTDRGVFRSTDGGRTWRRHSRGLRTPEVLTLTPTPQGGILAGTAGHGVYHLRPGAKRWQHLGDPVGVGEWPAWDRRLYQYSALLFDPRDPDRLLLGHFPGGFFVSPDGGRTWRSSNLGVGNDGMFSLVAHPFEPQRLFAGTYNGILRSDDGGATWTDASAGMPPEQWPFAVVISQQHPDLMYATTKNGQNKGFCERNHDTFCGLVLRSLDGGRSWQRCMQGLPEQAEYYMLETDPRDHDVLYLSSSRGVFVSADGGEHWAMANTGLPVEEFFVRDNVAQNMKLTPDGRYLLLGIVGHGIWRAELPDLADAA